MNDAARSAIGGIATSMASFIAEIDSNSRDVADYIAQRLSALAEIEGCDCDRLVGALELIDMDERKLVRP